MRRMVKCKMPGVSLMCPSGVDIFCAEYRAVYDAMTNPPDADIAIQQDTMVRALVNDGVWSLLDVFYLFAQQSNTDGEALINWINPGIFDATLHGVVNPAFTSLEGFTGNPAQLAYINSNYNANTDKINYSQNFASVGCYLRNNLADNNYWDVGANDGTSRIVILPRNAADTAAYYLNTNLNATFVSLDTRGFHILTRPDVNNHNYYINNILKKTDTDVSTGIPNVNIFLLAYNNNGAPAYHSARQMSIFFAASFLDNAKRQILQDAIETYMDYSGKGVI